MKKQNFLKGSVILMASAVIAKALGAVFKIPLTNMLGGVGMSYFSCAYSLFMPVYALTVTGLSSAVARMAARSAALGMYDNIRRIRRTAHLIFAGVGTLGSLLILLLAKPFSMFSSGSSEATLAVAMIAPSVLFGCITAVERGYYEGLSNMYPTALSQTAEGIVKVVAGLYLCGYVSSHGLEIMAHFPQITDIRAVAAAAGILGVTLSSAGAAVFFGILAIFRRRERSRGESHLEPRKKIAGELMRTSLTIGFSALVTNLTAIIDMWTIIGCIRLFGCPGKMPVGVDISELPEFIYGSFSGIALTVFNLVPSVTNMLGKGILPEITGAWSSKDRDALRKNSVQGLLTAAVIAVPCAFGLGVLSPQVLHLLFSRQSDEMAVCINALRLLMPGMVCLCLSFPLFSMLQAVGKVGAPLKIMLAGTAVKLAGNLALIPFMGADGAAVSTSLCYGVILVLSVRTYVRAAGISLKFGEFASVLYAGAMCGAAAWLTADVCGKAGSGELTIILASAMLGGGVYILSLYLLSVKKEAIRLEIR